MKSLASDLRLARIHSTDGSCGKVEKISRDSIPAVFLRWSGCVHYQKWVVSVATRFTPMVVMIAERKCSALFDQMYLLENVSATFVPIESLYADLTSFESVFPKNQTLFERRNNGRKYEFASFARYFVLLKFMECTGLQHAFVLDDDVLLFTNLEYLGQRLLSQSRFPSTTVMAKAGHLYFTSFWSIRGLQAVCSFFIRLYKETPVSKLLAVSALGGAVLDNDMSALWCYAVPNCRMELDLGVEVVDSYIHGRFVLDLEEEIQKIAGMKDSVLDHTFCIRGKSGYRQKILPTSRLRIQTSNCLEVPQLEFEEGRPWINFNMSGNIRRKAMLTVHFQGPMKNAIIPYAKVSLQNKSGMCEVGETCF